MSCCGLEKRKYVDRYVEAPLGSEEPTVLFTTRSMPVIITSVFLPCLDQSQATKRCLRVITIGQFAAQPASPTAKAIVVFCKAWSRDCGNRLPSSSSNRLQLLTTAFSESSFKAI